MASTSMREVVVRSFVDCDLEKLEKGFDDLSKKNMIGKRFLSEPEILSRLGQHLFRHRGTEIFIPAHHQVPAAKTGFAIRYVSNHSYMFYNYFTMPLL